MPAGVFYTEIDKSLYAATDNDTVFGVVGVFNKGAINTRTSITSIGDLEETFGKPIDSDTNCQAWFAIREFLRYANNCVVIRADSAATPATYAYGSLRGTSDQSITTADDGITSIPATKQLTNTAGTNFATAGVLIGDIVEIADVSTPADNGFYVITNVVTTTITVDRNWPTGSGTGLTFTIWNAKKEAGTDGATSVPATRQFTSALSTFSTNGVLAGDIIYIADVGTDDDNGYYQIASVTNETTLVVNRDFPVGSLSNLTFTIYGSLGPQADDGSVTDGDATFTAATGKFQAHDVQTGDILIIEDTVDTENNGEYYILSVTNETTLEICNTVWTTNATLTYRIFPGKYKFTPASKGTAYAGWTVKSKTNAADIAKFDLEFYDADGFLIEKVWSVDDDDVVANVAAGSANFTCALGANRSGPASENTAYVNGGDDGATGTVDADFIGSTTTGLGLLRNSEIVNVDLIAVPGQTSQNIGDALVTLAESRGDCLALLDMPDYSTIDNATEAVEWHNGTGSHGRTSAVSSSYAAVYYSWPQIYDNYNDADRYTAPSGHVAGVIAYSDYVSGGVWSAPAGKKRGRISWASDLRYSPDLGERTTMTGGTNCVNPIVNFLADGIIVYGQKTCLRSSSALNRIKTRRIMCYLEGVIVSAVQDLTFEPNDSATWREFIRLVTPPLKQAKSNRGISDYLVICDSTTNTAALIAQNKMKGKIFLKPTPTAEEISIDFIVTAQDVDFSEYIAA